MSKEQLDDHHRPGMNQPATDGQNPGRQNAKNRGPGVKNGAAGNPPIPGRDQPAGATEQRAAERNGGEKAGEKPKGRGTY